MRGTWRRADKEARGGAGTGRRSAAVGKRVALGGGGGAGGTRRRWGRGWRGNRETRGDGRQEGAHTGGRGVLEVLLQVGAFNIENAPRCILVPSCIYISYSQISLFLINII
jgi:hypothetical protein